MPDQSDPKPILPTTPLPPPPPDLRALDKHRIVSLLPLNLYELSRLDIVDVVLEAAQEQLPMAPSRWSSFTEEQRDRVREILVSRRWGQEAKPTITATELDVVLAELGFGR